MNKMNFKIEQIDIITNKIIKKFDNLKDVSRYILKNLHNNKQTQIKIITNIQLVCFNIKKSAYNYNWRYEEKFYLIESIILKQNYKDEDEDELINKTFESNELSKMEIKQLKRIVNDIYKLNNTLYESKARWRIVFGHHPWISFGKNNKLVQCTTKLDDFYNKISDTNKIDLIISGHHNSQQHIYIPQKPNMIISGVGGLKGINYLNDDDVFIAKELKFKTIESGCVKIDVEKNTLSVFFINTKNEILYKFKIKKI